MNTANTTHGHRSVWTGRVLAGAALAIVAAGCSVTQKETPELPGGRCALIPRNICSQLVPGTAGEMGLRYVAPGVQWSQYSKVLISPVTGWGDTSDPQKQKLSAADAQELTNYLYNLIVKDFGEKFQLVDQPGPGVMRVSAAITDAEAATPGLRSVSMAVPQARVLGTLKYAATGTYPFVGTAQGEFLVTDSVTGRVLAAAVDRRVGGGSVENAAQWQWGDAENVMNKWAELGVARLQALQAGKQ